MIYFDVRLHNARTTTVSIRRLANTSAKGPEEHYAYEVNYEGKPRRGTVTHHGPEDITLITAVLTDYTRQYGR